MNLRIPDAPAMVEFLHRIVMTSGTPILSVEGWRVVTVDGRFFYHGTAHVEVGGPYSTLGALLQDVGQRAHVGWVEGSSHEVLWEVRIWGGAYFTIWAAHTDTPSRHGSLDAARLAGTTSRRG